MGIFYARIGCQATENQGFRTAWGGVTLTKKYRGVIRIGFGYAHGHDCKYDRCIIDINGNVIFEGDAHLGIGARLVVTGNSTCILGNHLIINGKSTIISNHKIVFGRNCLISWGCLIMDTDMHKLFDQNRKCINYDQEIVIGDNCWICCNSIILKGSTIPDGSVIAAGSIVTQKFKVNNTMIVDNQIKRNGITWQY